MPSGGAGRGQGRHLAPAQFTGMIGRIGRMVERLERQGKPEGEEAIEITLGAVRLNAYVNRLLVLLDIERPPQPTEEEREAAHAWAEEKGADS